MTDRLRVLAYTDTDTGLVRKGNEDSHYAGMTVFAVADGMGGHVAGEVASRTALEPIADLDGREFADPQQAQHALVEAITAANAAVMAEGDADPDLQGMGTTLTVVMLRAGRLHLAHVGDSRAYLLRPDVGLSQLTTDHTLVEQLIRDGRLSREQAATHPQRSVITRAIGVERDLEVDSLPPIELQPGDQVLLCSDGLTGPVDDEDIARLLDPGVDGRQVCASLIDAANRAGGPDNITVVLLRVGARSETPWPAEDGGGRDAPTQRLAPLAAQEPAGAPPAPGRPPHTRSSPAAPPHGPPAAPPHDAPPGRPQPPPGSPAWAGDPPPETVRPIRTRDESTTSEHWAERMGRFGQEQGARGGGPAKGFGGRAAHRHRGGFGRTGSTRRGMRLAAGGLAAVVLLGLLVAGGYVLLTRSYFVGDDDGRIAIFNGLPQTVGGLPLFWPIETTELRTSELPERLAERVREDGVSAASLIEAREVVERYRDMVDEQREGDAGAGQADDGGGAPATPDGAGTDDAGADGTGGAGGSGTTGGTRP